MDAGIPKLSVPYLKKALLIITACIGMVLMNRNTIASYPDTGHFPEAPILVDILAEQMTPQDRLIVDCPTDAPMHFYMWYKNVPSKHHKPDGNPAPREFVVVKPSRQSVWKMTRRKVRLLISFGDAKLYVTDTEDDAKPFQQ